jgi:dihydrofolate reductase
MSRIIASMFTTVDGYIEGIDHDIDWFVGAINDPLLDQATHALLSNAGTIVAGSRVYDALAGYWPTEASAAELYADQMNTLPKLIFSRSRNQVSWGSWDNARLATGGIRDEVASVRAASDKDIVIFGGSSIIHGFTLEDLIDEYRMLVCPIALRNGTPFFRNADEPLSLSLLSARAFPSGVIELRYTPRNRLR